MAVTRMGPGTITVGETPLDFSAEVRTVSISHEYDETSEAVTYLDGSGSSASLQRADSVSFETDSDLGAAGLYAYIQENDLSEQEFSYTPNTVAGASWAGTVQIRLPEEIGADGYGNPIAASLTWSVVGELTFTPIPAGP